MSADLALQTFALAVAAKLTGDPVGRIAPTTPEASSPMLNRRPTTDCSGGCTSTPNGPWDLAPWPFSRGRLGAHSTFKIYLPASNADEGLQALAVEPRDETDVAEHNNADHMVDATALVVDDHAAVSQLTTEILEEAGYTVIQARSAADANAVLAEHAVDVVLSDIVMPGGNGQAPTYPQDARE